MSQSIITTIVIPVYNERESIGDVISETVDVFEQPRTSDYTPFELVVIDDGSTDGTSKVLQESVNSVPQLRAIVLRRNFGKSAALSAGFSHSSGKYIVTLDGDGQNVPENIPNLLETLENGFDCVSGWRKDRHDPLRKTIPSAIETWFARLTGPDIHDFGCGLKVYRSEAVNAIELYGENHRYIPAQLHKHGYRVTEKPVDHRPRRHGTTKYGISRLPKGFIDLVFNAFWNRFSTRPLHLFGGVGILLFAIGGAVGLYTLILKYIFGTPLLSNLPSLLLTVVFILFGFQLVMFGTLAEILTKLYYREDKPYQIDAILGTETSRESSLMRGVDET